MIQEYNGNGNEMDNTQPDKIEIDDDCGEHPPYFVPMQNRLSNATEILTVRAKCVKTCSRFCRKCGCCKFKCGHIMAKPL